MEKTKIVMTNEEKTAVKNTIKSDVKGIVKDSVFRDLFENRKYLKTCKAQLV